MPLFLLITKYVIFIHYVKFRSLITELFQSDLYTHKKSILSLSIIRIKKATVIEASYLFFILQSEYLILCKKLG